MYIFASFVLFFNIIDVYYSMNKVIICREILINEKNFK